MNKSSILKTTQRGWYFVGSTWAKLAALVSLGSAAVAGLTYLYARQIEPRWIEFNSQRIPIRGLSSAFAGYRIVQLSDLHLRTRTFMTPHRLEALLRRVNALRPDLVLITGDFVSHVDEVSLEGISRLRTLKATDGVYGILGNHDYWSGATRVVQAAEDAGIRMLVNQHVIIQRHGVELALAGLDDIWTGEYDLDKALCGIPDHVPTILMAHESNFAEFAAKDSRIVFQLSGHSHGGQIRVPGIGPLVLPDQAGLYPMGKYRVRNMWLYVSRGIGVAQMPLRFNCRPEITNFVLLREQP